jgi:tetratricopeptide (TPR) repeat protein
MTTTIKRSILRAAVAAVPLLGLATSASAQYRLPYDGKAADASNKVGSGGTNQDVNKNGVINGNDIVTGNVTAGKEFRGNVPYHNAREFRGASPSGPVDDFVRGSSSADPHDSGSSYRVQPFYGSRTVAPPPGYTPQLGTSSYIPPSPQATNARPAGDLRLGTVNIQQPTYSLPMPGELLLPGPVDPTSGQQYISATPLTGIRQVGAGDPTAFESVSNTQYNPVTSRLSKEQIQKMQDELSNSPSDQTTPTGAQPGGLLPGQPGAITAPGAQPQGVGQSAVLQQPAAGAAAMVAQPVNSTGATGSTDQSVRQRMLIPPPEAQSATYAKLLKAFKDQASAANDKNISDADAARAYNAAQMEQQKAKLATGQPGAAAPGQPGAAAAPGAADTSVTPGGAGVVVPPPAGSKAPAAPAAAPSAAPGVTDFAKQNEEIMKRTAEEKAARAKKPEPVKVHSLAADVKSKGLADVLKNAEALMKEGKFTSALDQYDQAEQVAPNNPLIRLGRANAELGASYYARADTHLREVLSNNPELLTGQYDLTALLGEQRLQTLVKDLKEISNKDKNESRPLFLLAYIAYNTGHEANAAAYIDMADKRSGGKDTMYKLLRDNWALPDKPAGAVPAGTPADVQSTEKKSTDLNK